MFKKRFLEKISSKYILQTIFNYVKNPNFKMKLFMYSKSFQKRLELNLEDYKENYIKQSGINFDNYLLLGEYVNWNFNTNILKEQFKEILIRYKLDFNDIKSCIINHFENLINIKKGNNEKEFNIYEYDAKKIDIYSPFFDLISKNNIFEQLFSISIPMNLIKSFNLKNDYILNFDKLNKSNSQYSSLTFNYEDNNDIDYLKELKINFSQIKRLTIKKEATINNYFYFFKTLFSFDNIENNLVYLDLKISVRALNNFYEKIEPSSFENLNNFKSLKFLRLEKFKFKSTFILKLYNLNSLSLMSCENITLDEKTCLNIKNLTLFDCLIIKQKTLLKFPELENYYLISITTQERCNLIIDFSSLKKLKRIVTDSCDFVYLENSLVEHITLNPNIKNITNEKEEKMLRKLLSINTLKFIDLGLGKINDEEIIKIPGENTSVTSIHINWSNQDSDCILYNLQKKFPNLTSLDIWNNTWKSEETNLEIKENSNCKIKEFSITGSGGSDIKFYIQSYENLISVCFDFDSDIINIREFFPIFNDNCKVEFKSLTYFKSNFSHEISLDILKNIYNNIDKLPNLRNFNLSCNIKNIDEIFFKKFVEKILLLKLDNIELSITKDIFALSEEEYSDYELKEIYPEIQTFKLNNVHIKKFK